VFHTAFIKVGLSGAELGAAWRLQRTMGLSRAREAMLTGRPITAEDALKTGLVSSVVADEALDEHGLGLAKAMCEARPDALRLTKRSLDAALEIGSFDAAMEMEERAQMLMIARRPRPQT
jgi:enoyl-CoA hydratase/carnithine racemase